MYLFVSNIEHSFIGLACVWSGRRTHFTGCSRFGACSFRKYFERCPSLPLEGQREAPLAALDRAALKPLIEALIGAY